MAASRWGGFYMTALKIRFDRWFPNNAFRAQVDLAFRLAVLAVAIAFAVGLIGAWSEGTGFLLFILALPVTGSIVFIGALVLVVHGFRWFAEFDTRRQRIVAILVGPATAGIVGVAFLPVLWAGGWTGDLSRLAANHADYEAIIAEARQSHQDAWFAESRGITYIVDRGPPLRVAFNPAGFLDNWSGIVFDPTGEVMLADGFDERGKFAAPDRITKIFGGDLVQCRHLWGDYYTCSFT